MTRKETPADLCRKIRELEAQLTSTLAAADKGVGNAGDVLMGSAVIVSLHALGGREIAPAFAIRDGLSVEAIAAIRRDIARSYQLATIAKPKGV